jgi:hypothetical protein
VVLKSNCSIENEEESGVTARNVLVARKLRLNVNSLVGPRSAWGLRASLNARRRPSGGAGRSEGRTPINDALWNT